MQTSIIVQSVITTDRRGVMRASTAVRHVRLPKDKAMRMVLALHVPSEWR